MPQLDCRETKLNILLRVVSSLLLIVLPSLAVLPRVLEAHTILVAKRIDSPSELCRGPEAKGEVGHYLLMNAEIKAIISSPDYAYAFSSSGGNLLDLARTNDNDDGFTHFYTLLNTYWPNQANYTNVEVLKDGRDDQQAVIRATGFDLENPQIKVVTDYSLGPHDRFITIVSRITNQSGSAIEGYAVGDAVQWGVTDNFAPGVGYELLNVNNRFPWVATQGDRISYGYALEAPDFDSMNHSTWTDSYVRNILLEPNRSYVFKRYLSVGNGSVASAAEVLMNLKHVPLGTVEGFLKETGTGTPVHRATITFSTSSYSPYVTTTSDRHGHFLAQVPEGTYEVSVKTPDRSGPATKTVEVKPQTTASVDFGFGPRGWIRYAIRDSDTHEMLPAKIIVTHPSGDNPYFGSPEKAAGALNTVFTASGEGAFSLPPGDYRITGAHGLAFSVAWQKVHVSSDHPVSLRLELKREVQAAGWFTGDFHVHANPSDDSMVTLRDRVTSLVAEGIQLVAATDHNVITDYSPTVREMKLEKQIFAVAGDELTTVKWGHFNVFPLIPHPDERWGGARSVLHKTPDQIFAEARAQDHGSDKIIEVNHPRWPYQKHAYFDSVQLDTNDLKGSESRGFSLNFDALEIMNGLWSGEKYFATQEILKDWFGLLNHGYRFTAVGNSDSHTVVMQEVGYPRNYVFLGKNVSIAKMNSSRARTAGEHAVVEAIKHHRVVVSNGPFVAFNVGGNSRIGDLVSLPAKEGPVKFQIHAEWPEWMGPMDELEIFANGNLVHSLAMTGSKSPADFSFETAPVKDTWFVATVRGSRPLQPVLPELKGRADTPFAVTNPIWVDRDGNGIFDVELEAANKPSK